MQLQTGVIVDERYEVLAALGMGGFGTVYKALDLKFDRVVALKVLHDYATDDFHGEVLERFSREAHALSTMQHRNLVLFFGYGFWEGNPYIALEFIGGRNLQRVLAMTEKLDFKKALDITRQICEALRCAHANGVIHRDLKPENVILVEQSGIEIVKLIDFGLAKILRPHDPAAQSITEAGTTVGTVEYMSPEQCLGHPIDARSDLYSLGCIFYQLLTGRPPFVGEHSVVVMQGHINSRLDTLDPVAFGAYAVLLQPILNRALAKSPDDRYQSADEMAHDLAALLDNRNTHLFAEDAAVPQGLMPTTKRKLTAVWVGCFSIAMAFSAFLVCVYGPANKIANVHHESSHQLYRKLYSDFDDGQMHKMSEPEGIELAEEALEVNKADHLLSPGQMAFCENCLAVLLFRKKDFHRAMMYAEYSTDHKLMTGKVDWLFSAATEQYARAAIELNMPRKAVGKVRNLIESAGTRAGKCTGELNVTLAKCYAHAGQYAEAREILRKYDGKVNDELQKDIKAVNEYLALKQAP